MNIRPAPPGPGSRPDPARIPSPFNRNAGDIRYAAYERVKKRTGLICEECGVLCRKPSQVDANHPGYVIVHQDGNGRNYEGPNLLLFCLPCYQRNYMPDHKT